MVSYTYKGFQIELGRQEYRVVFPDGKTFVACSGAHIYDAKKEAEDVVNNHIWIQKNEILLAVKRIENEKNSVS